MENGNVRMSGKGSGVNQFLFYLGQNYLYQADAITFAQVYQERVQSINNSTNEEVIKHKAFLLGNAQGEYLDKVFGSLIDSKAHNNSGEIKEVNFTDLNIKLLLEIII